MSALRRRPGNVPRTSSPEPTTTAEATAATTAAETTTTDDSGGDSGTVVSNLREEIRHVEVPVFKRRSKRRNGFIFGLGGLFGVFIALFFANQNEVISFDALMDLNLESLIDVIPAAMVRDAKEFTVWSAYHLEKGATDKLAWMLTF